MENFDTRLWEGGEKVEGHNALTSQVQFCIKEELVSELLSLSLIVLGSKPAPPLSGLPSQCLSSQSVKCG